MSEKGKEIVEVEAVDQSELKPSAWVERTSSGKLKFGCKSRQVELGDAVTDVVEQIKRMKKELVSEFESD